MDAAPVQVVVAQKPFRGQYPSRDGYGRIDATSGSANRWGSVSATQVSPLYMGPVMDCDGEQCNCFENAWQFRKVYPQLGHWDEAEQKPSEAWHQWRRAGYQKLKNGKGLRLPDDVAQLKKEWRQAPAHLKDTKRWTPKGCWWQGELLGYIEARKRFYVPEYARYVQQTEAFKEMQKLVQGGAKVMVLDFDGPPLAQYPRGMDVTLENMQRMLDEPAYPFGHGYVLACLLAGIDIPTLCGDTRKRLKVDPE